MTRIEAGIPLMKAKWGSDAFYVESIDSFRPPTHHAYPVEYARALEAVVEAVRLLREASDRYCASEGEEFEDEYANATAAVFAALDAFAAAGSES